MYSAQFNLAIKELREIGYHDDEISKAVQDVNTRLLWKKHSHCLLYSRRYEKWFSAEIIDILINQETKQKWLMVKYNGKYTKKIQRFNKNISTNTINTYTSNANHYPIVSYISNKLNTNLKIIKSPIINKPKKMIKKRRKRKKQKKYYSGLGIDTRSEPQRFWKTINISIVMLVLYGYMHHHEAKYGIFIPGDLIDLITKFFYYNKYVEVHSQRYRDDIDTYNFGQRIDDKLEIIQNSLFKFYASKCPQCRKTTKNGNAILSYLWSLRGQFSRETPYRNNANVYECMDCGYFVVVNVKDYCFVYNQRLTASNHLRYKCFVTPFGSLPSVVIHSSDSERINILRERYETAGKCHECDFDTIRLAETRETGRILKKQKRYCISCGLFHEEHRIHGFWE